MQTCRLTMVLCFVVPLSCALPESLEPPEPPTTADQGPALESRFQGAQRVVVASVVQVSAAFGHNSHGDKLIISTVTLQVHERLRGAANQRVSFELEGGTVGDVTLEVSDLPTLAAGDRGVFALRRGPLGRLVPNRRGLGILLLTPPVDLRRVRRAEEVTR